MREKRVTEERLSEIAFVYQPRDKGYWDIHALMDEVRALQLERDAARQQVADLRGHLGRIGCMLPRSCPGPNAMPNLDLLCIRCGALRETEPPP